MPPVATHSGLFTLNAKRRQMQHLPRERPGNHRRPNARHPGRTKLVSVRCEGVGPMCRFASGELSLWLAYWPPTSPAMACANSIRVPCTNIILVNFVRMRRRLCKVSENEPWTSCDCSLRERAGWREVVARCVYNKLFHVSWGLSSFSPVLLHSTRGRRA